MNKNKETIKALNKLLQGEYMAVEGFNTYMSKLEDDKTKKVFQDVQSHHRSNIEKLSKYIQDLGGKPDENIGFKGTMADLQINMELMKNRDTNYIVKQMIEGETKGINMAEKVLRGNLDEESRKLCGEVLENDRNYLDELNKLM